MAIHRREFLRLGAAGATLGLLSPLFRVPFLNQAVHAATLGPSSKRLIFVFLRGGNDSLNTVIPHGDADYNDTADARPTLYIPPSESIDLNGFCALHPQLDKAHELFLANELAVIHRVAYPNQSRSHFSSQQYWENSVPGDVGLEEGWLNRLIANHDPFATHEFPGASIASRVQTAFKGDLPIPQFSNLNDYHLNIGAGTAKFIGAAPSGGSDGSGILGVFGATPDAFPFDTAIRDNGLVMGHSLDALEVAGVDANNYVPGGGATYPSSSEPGDFVDDGRAWTFFRRLRNGVQLMKEVDLQVFGVDLSGFDTHGNQAGGHGELLHGVAHGLRSLKQDLESSGMWNDTVVVVASEFGRTSRENGNEGTDHGEAGAMFVAGGNVNGGVYNGDASTWSTGDIYGVNDKYLSHLTDFRTVYGEILTGHMGVPTPLIDTVVPGLDSLTGPAYDPVGLFL